MSAVNVPDARALVTRAGNEELSVARKVERIDFLVVTRQEVLDAFLCNVPDLQEVSGVWRFSTDLEFTLI